MKLFIASQQDLAEAVERLGILPLFANSLTGFSVEEHVAPKAWFSNEPGVWEWKGPVIRETGCAYGKFFEHKAAFVSASWFAELANYRRDGYDFDARWEDGLTSYKDKRLYELLAAHEPVLSRHLKTDGDYRKGGNTGFDTSMTRLQEQCYVVISDFVYERDRYGHPYGWGVAEYSTPEKWLGEPFSETVYLHEPQESYELLAVHLQSLLPRADEKDIRRFLH